MQFASLVTRMALSFAIAGGGLALSGCQSMRESLGGAKAPPDEFTIVTAAPLIIPPDYNLRPPAPGAGPRVSNDPSSQARAALYSGTAEAAAASLGSTYSDGEKMLLARTGASNTDPAIRRTISAETGYDSGDAALTDRVLTTGGGAAPTSSAPVAPHTPPSEGPIPSTTRQQ